ncbi:MAG: UPF0175 family protein, partial [Candidatus Saliniplasma sp.]
SEKEMKVLKKIAEEEGKDLSTTARELIEYGRKYRAIHLYKEGKISLGKAAEELEIPLTEFMDLLHDFNIPANISYEDYLKGMKEIEKVW